MVATRGVRLFSFIPLYILSFGLLKLGRCCMPTGSEFGACNCVTSPNCGSCAPPPPVCHCPSQQNQHIGPQTFNCAARCNPLPFQQQHAAPLPPPPPPPPPMAYMLREIRPPPGAALTRFPCTLPMGRSCLAPSASSLEQTMLVYLKPTPTYQLPRVPTVYATTPPQKISNQTETTYRVKEIFTTANATTIDRTTTPPSEGTISATTTQPLTTPNTIQTTTVEDEDLKQTVHMPGSYSLTTPISGYLTPPTTSAVAGSTRQYTRGRDDIESPSPAGIKGVYWAEKRLSPYSIYNDQLCTGITQARSIERSFAAAAERCTMMDCAAVNVRSYQHRDHGGGHHEDAGYIHHNHDESSSHYEMMEAIYMKSVDSRHHSDGYHCIAAANVRPHVASMARRLSARNINANVRIKRQL